MDNIIVRNVRCFLEEQQAPIRPITVLIGENSSGKSTFLAATRIAWDLLQGKQDINFNEEPFVLGTFDRIATFRGGKAGRAKEFTIGIEIEGVDKEHRNNKPIKVKVLGTFIPDVGKPKLSEWAFLADQYQFRIAYGEDRKPVIRLKTPSGEYYVQEFPIFQSFPSSFGILEMFSILRFTLRDRNIIKVAKGEQPSEREFDHFDSLGRIVYTAFRERPYAIAPIRTRPSVTYDPLKDIPTPEGSHVPILLAKLSSTDKAAWSALRQSLDSFGKVSGLFDDVEVRRMGQKEGDPFQLTVKISGPPFNLAYVGYGISQVLPILVDAIQAPPGSMFLLQQPEVHLHPRAQAELGSFLASVASVDNKRFIIETHSDYLLDRIRMDVRDKKGLRAQDISILFFERKGSVVSIKQIEIDERGRLIDTPAGYRHFFLEEERRLLVGES